MKSIESKGGRKEALEVLYILETKGGHADELLSSLFEESGLSKKDRALATQLVYGVLRWRNRLDWIVEQFSSRKLKKTTPWILNILRLGIYQQLFLDRIPHSAAVNESVKLAHRFGHRGTAAFVNALLREVSRKKEEIDYPGREKGPVFYLSVTHSHPGWLVARWLKRFGFDTTEEICSKNNLIPPLTIRVNSLKTTVRELKQELEEKGLSVTSCYYAENGLKLNIGIDFLNLDSFKKGLFQVQDEASMLIADLLSPDPGSTILDVCAAPGGKTTHLAQMMSDQGDIFAGDLRKERLDRLKDNCRRLGINGVKVFCIDARKTLPFKRKFDGILIDAPCSNLGVLRRNPDARWQKSESDINFLAGIQYEILENVSLLLKKGGALVYSTCSYEPEETREVIKRFLKNNHDFIINDPKPFLTESARELVNGEGYFESLPANHEMDGFFGVRLKRLSS